MIPLILIAIGIILIVYNYKTISKRRTSFEFTLNEEKENLNDYKLELGLLRKDIGESLTELQQEIETIKVNLNMINDTEEEYDNILDSNIDKLKTNAEEEIIIEKENKNKEQNDKEEIIVKKDNKKDQSKLETVDSGVISEINFKSKKAFKGSLNKKQSTVNETEEEFIIKATTKKNQVSNESNKQQMITDLIKQNLTDGEICKALSISKGEVLLVRNLFKS